MRCQKYLTLSVKIIPLYTSSDLRKLHKRDEVCNYLSEDLE